MHFEIEMLYIPLKFSNKKRVLPEVLLLPYLVTTLQTQPQTWFHYFKHCLFHVGFCSAMTTVATATTATNQTSIFLVAIPTTIL